MRMSFAAFQDFTAVPGREFHGEWGSVSRGGLVKPVGHALALLGYLTRPEAQGVRVRASAGLVVRASRRGNVLHLLASRLDPPPLYDGTAALLFGAIPLNMADLTAAGYRSWDMIDSTMRGLRPSQGPPALIAGFNAARTAYADAERRRYTTAEVLLTLDCRMEGRGLLVRLDSAHNDVIADYERLCADGTPHAQALATLLARPSPVVDSVELAATSLTLLLPPNGILYAQLPFSCAVSVVEAPLPLRPGVTVYPHPFHDRCTFRIAQAENARDGRVTLTVHDALGRELARLHDGPLAAGVSELPFDVPGEVAAGLLYYRLLSGGVCSYGPLLRH
jgi:hypothetical protein